MDTSDSSDDEKDLVGGKKSKLKIVDVAENDADSSPEEKDIKEPVKVFVKKNRKKKSADTKRKQNRPRTTSTSDKQRKKTAHTGLNGNYWNVVQIDRHAHTTTSNRNQFKDDDDEDDDTTSLSERAANEKLETLLTSTSSSSSNDLRTLLYSNRTFITCRSPADSFFLCQVLQDVFNDAKKIRIRWCSLADENGDETNVDENTRFKLDYEDTLDLNTILTGIGNVIRHSDKTISLKKQDIIETKRLLEKSIKGETISSDEPMDLTKDNNNKTFESIKPDSSDDDSLAIKPTTTTTTITTKAKKRKISSDSLRKQPVKKRIRKISGEAAPIKKRRRTKDIIEITAGEKPTKKTATKPITTTKAQLFKVQSNRLLKENLDIINYRTDPFFEDNLPLPFISSIVHSKLSIRAVLINDSKLLKSLIDDVDRVCSVHVKRSLHNDLTAIHYAIKNDNIEMIKILIEDLKTPKKDRCPFPTVTMTTQSTGRANTYTFGFRTAQIMAGRGVKEGNNALNKDPMTAYTIHNGNEIIEYAIKNNCSRQIYDLLFEAFPHSHRHIYDKIFQIVRSGYRKLAASIIGDIKDNAFYGFNNLHHQVLLFDNEDLTINRAASVTKKARDNFHLTPIHCAAINPNSKYLKQLLNIAPEYNILDKYERRPIHFAAACEGPEPLEYLLSKQVNFNDVDRGGNSPLHIAVMNGRAINAEIVLRTAKEKAESNDPEDQIVHQKFGLASINRMNKSRFYPLHLAVLNDHLECVKVLLEFGANVDVLTSTSSGKLTSLMLACQKGYFKIVKYLIENGARVEARDRFKRTPLIHACMCGNAHIVSYLLRMGANANIFDSSLNTALHYAIAYGWYFCVRLLIEAGANVNCVNSWQTTCLAAGFLKGHYGLCDYLLTEHHVDINFKTDDGLTLVMLSVGLEISLSSQQQLDYVVTKHNADCTCVDATGSNAFHYLASNTSGQRSHYMNVEAKNTLRDNFFKMAQILLDHKCDPNKMNNKVQSPLMIALESGNFILVDYLINIAKIEINADISHDGKTLLHYFAIQCNEYDLIQKLIKLPINDQIKKMGQMFDDTGRTPFHYCASKFNEFCQQNKSSQGTDQLKQQYQSILEMIEYCLESVQCDPDVEIKQINELNKSENEQDIDDENDKDEQTNENIQPMDDTNDEEIISKPKETSIFSLLSTVQFIDNTIKHPLEIFLKKSKNLNVLHHETQRTPLLQAIFLQEYQTVHMLINESSCDINLATSILSNERQQTPLIFACKLQLLRIIRELLNHKQCHILTYDYQYNQAIHYYLSTSKRSNQYIDILNLFIDKIKLTNNNLNIQGKSERTPLHIAVYHNTGAIDSTTDVEEILIDNGSDLLIKDKLGNMPLHNVFINKNVGDDPVELCVLISKAMKYKLLDTENNEGNTPLHLAVAKCSTVCVMLLQQHSASLFIENKLSNSIIGTCIGLGHLNLFITFLQQSIDIDLGKLYTLPISNSSSNSTKETFQYTGLFAQAAVKGRTQLITLGNHQQSISVEQKDKSLSKKDHIDIWRWKYVDIKIEKQYIQHSSIYLIIERDWQGALSLILNEVERFHLSIIQILEAAILNNKLNLVLRLLSRIKEKNLLHEKNSQDQNLFHLLANMNQYDENLLKQILLQIHEYHLEWNIADKYGSYPIHYACVKQNFILINFLREKYLNEFSLNQIDSFDNTPIGLLFWTIGSETSFKNEQICSLITSRKQLDCLCNYDNEIAMNPLSFGYIDSSIEKNLYPPIKSDNPSTNVRTSPLINAIIHNNFKLVKFLLDLNADVNFPDEEKRTPLMHAVRQNNIDIVKLLLNKDYTPTENDETLLNSQRAGKGGRVLGRIKRAPQKFFLGATTTTTISSDIANETSHDDNETDKFEVTSSIDLNAKDSLGRTCIHHLVQPFPDGTYTSNIELLRLLHSSGASLTKHDLAGLSPLQYGAINGCQHVCDELTKLINDQKNSTQATIERFYINDPNKNLLDPLDFYFDAQQYIDKYISKRPLHKQNTAYEVDRLSGMNVTGEVLIDTDKNEPYDVRLTKTDVNYGIHGLYNFYRMQIIKHKSKNNLYFLFTRWGRIGDDGQYQLTPYSTLDECRKEFLKVFREKTGNAWKDTDQFEIKPKKYTLIKLNERDRYKYSTVPINFNRLQSEQIHPPSKLQSLVFKNFLRTLINRQAIRMNIDKTQLDIEWMPVSQLNRDTLQKARDLLIKIKQNLEKKQELNLEMQRTKSIEQQNEIKSILEIIYKYTNEYYSIIPLRGYADEKLPIIDSEQILRKQEKIIYDLLELELSYKMFLGAQVNLKNISPLDYLYKSMNCQFEAMNKDDIDSQLILRYIWASTTNIKVEQIFKIARPNEDERLFKSNLDNHYLLWHGTSICNLISILTRGLLVGPLDATTTGSLFGKGIYTADTFEKSLNYCSGITQNDGERCFMILCEVALGKIKEVGLNHIYNDDDTKELDLSQFQSRKGVGRNIPDPRYTITRNYGVRMPLGKLINNTELKSTFGGLNYNEYIVYDESQVALRYLVQFRR
ncbi:unnamed protein product [Rotaria sordida]|uniref:Poly [ADP-ribose] polymerase n=1 Tax=Rotaria sordida TaxID=392033 RepID=A0A814VUQ6_9BILA|nr:unnamed protein product [Rotaria sordida]